MSAGYPTGNGLTLIVYSAWTDADGHVVKGLPGKRTDVPSGRSAPIDPRISVQSPDTHPRVRKNQ